MLKQFFCNLGKELQAQTQLLAWGLLPEPPNTHLTPSTPQPYHLPVVPFDEKQSKYTTLCHE